MHKRTESIESLYAEQDWLLALAADLLRSRDGAEDLVQDTWLKVLRGNPTKIRSPRAFLATTARRLFATRNESDEARRRREKRAESADQAPSTEELVARTEIQRLLHEALATLPAPQRQAIILRHFGGLSVSAIAEREGIAVESAKSRIKRGMKSLREQLDRQDNDGRSWYAIAAIALPSMSPSLTKTMTGGFLMGKKLLSAAAIVITLGIGAYFLSEFSSESTSDLDPTTADDVVVESQDPSRSTGSVPQKANASQENLETVTDVKKPQDKTEKAEPALKLVGRVTDEQGASIPNAKVYAHRIAPMPPSLVMDRAALVEFQWKDREVFEVTTDSDGRFQIPGVTAGTYDITAHSALHRVATAWGVKPGNDVSLKTVKGKPLTVTFKSEAGTPVANATILIMHFGMKATRHFLRKVHTGPSGKVVLPQTPKGDIYALVARHESYVLTSVPPITPDSKYEAKEVEVTLKRGRNLRIEFVPPVGRTIPKGTQVSIQAFSMFAPLIGTIDENNVLDVPNVPVLKRLFFLLKGASFQLEQDRKIPADKRARMVDAIARMGEPYQLPESGPVNLRIPLLELPTVSGQVTDLDDKPVANVEVELRPVAANVLAMKMGIQTAKTDAEGRFAFSDVPSGPRYVSVVSDTFEQVVDKDQVTDLGAVRVTEMVAFQVEVGRNIEDLKLKVDRAARIRGMVVNQDGKPVADVTVTAFRDFGDTRGARRNAAFLLDELSSPETQSNAAGQFELSGLAIDYPVRIVAHRDGQPVSWSKQLKLKAGSLLEDVQIVVAETREIEFVCLDENGSAVPGFEITLRQGKLAPFHLSFFVHRRIKGYEFHHDQSYVTDERGSFRTHVAPLPLQLRETDTKDALTVKTESVDFSSGTDDVERVTIQLARPRMLKAKLVDENGNDLAGVQCIVELTDESGTRRIRSDANSRAILEMRVATDCTMKVIRGARMIGATRQDFIPQSDHKIKADESDLPKVILVPRP